MTTQLLCIILKIFLQELKKDLKELKKEHNKNNQLSDEDLHFLDSDYGVDYNIHSNLGYNPSLHSMYPNYAAGRIQNPNPLAAYPGLYPGLYPGFYAPLTMPQAGKYVMSVYTVLLLKPFSYLKLQDARKSKFYLLQCSIEVRNDSKIIIS